MMPHESPQSGPRSAPQILQREPPEFSPRWADAWGDDRFGLWAEFVVKDVTQRLRWIEPGEFWMGSPDYELERGEDEGPRHRVRLSRGLWLADSACTQALWQAVMGDNPSHFKDDAQNPVEQVNWDEVQTFLARLREELAELVQPVLPTEAEWEYACRAGTETPFNLGAKVTLEQVNYGINYPNADGPEAEYRQKTVPVKCRPPNAWGLYQMHGNLWEWCDDVKRTYQRVPDGIALVDPQGSQEHAPEDLRAMRGGSWFVRSSRARSAARAAYRRDDRNDVLGFRLALRS